MQKLNILKWVTAGVLALSAVFFFLPYYSANGYTETVIEGLRSASGTMSAEIILRFVVPVGFTLLAALMMALRYGTAKCITATIFCGIAVFLYFYDPVDHSYAGIGLIGNMVIAIAGIVLPIATVILKKITAPKTANEA